MTIRNRLTFVAGVAIATAMGSASLAGSAEAFYACAAYADSAVQQNQRNERLGCGYHGIRWHNWHEGHASW
ncbi:MAG: hypothetical protein GC150_00380 [Rhizobiales bacterium]|nr:hypothetical protein [Hyphomicrobiales bacterium]